MMSFQIPCSEYYVYTYTSALDGKIFYVGKGRDGRYLEHIVLARKEDTRYHTPVVLAIQSIWKRGGKVIIRKLYKGLTDEEARDQEKSLIVYYGGKHLVNRQHLLAPTTAMPSQTRRFW